MAIPQPERGDLPNSANCCNDCPLLMADEHTDTLFDQRAEEIIVHESLKRHFGQPAVNVVLRESNNVAANERLKRSDRCARMIYERHCLLRQAVQTDDNVLIVFPPRNEPTEYPKLHSV